MKDYYALLGVDRSATKIEIKKNYRKLAIKYHPDKSTDPDASTKFIAITEAYDVLSNKKSRTQYDLFVWEKLKRKKAANDSYDVVVPPRESTRTRRNKVQQKRSREYHKTQSTFRLATEGFYIVSRYIPHVFGVTILMVILDSIVRELGTVISSGLVQGILFCVLILAIVYCIFLILKSVFLELKKDFEAFSVFYKISQKKAALITLSAFAIFLFVYVIILYAYRV